MWLCGTRGELCEDKDGGVEDSCGILSSEWSELKGWLLGFIPVADVEGCDSGGVQSRMGSLGERGRGGTSWDRISVFSALEEKAEAVWWFGLGGDGLTSENSSS